MSEEDRPKSADDTAEKPDDPSPLFSDHTYRVADLAVKIMGLVSHKHVHPEHSEYVLSEGYGSLNFDVARSRAERLLFDIEKREGTVSAYQFFEEGTCYSLQDIANVFGDAKWAGLKSKAPVTSLMDELAVRFDELYNKTTQLLPDEVEEFHHTLGSELEDFACKMRESGAPYPQFQLELNRFIDSLRSGRIDANSHEIWAEMRWLDAFKDWCILIDEKTQNKSYRAHEIFRFAEVNKWEKSSLSMKLSKLSPDCCPKPGVQYRSLNTFTKFNEKCDLSLEET